MKTYLTFLLVLVAVLCSGCAGSRAAKGSPEQSTAMPAAAPSPADNQTLERQAAQPDAPKLQAAPVKEPVAAAVTASESAAETPAALKSAKETGAATDNDTAGGISLNFDNADIYEVINALSDFLGISYIIDPAVKGRVNIHTSGQIEAGQLLPILETIFEMNNIAMVRTGDFYKILPVKEAQKEIIDINIGRELAEPESYDKVIIQLIPLKYIPSGEVAKVLKPFTGRGGDIVDYGKANILILIETAGNIKTMLDIINVLDTDTFEQTAIRFFKVKHADPSELAKELENVFTSAGIDKSSSKGIGLSIVPVDRAGYLIGVSAIPGMLDKVQHWVELLDAVDTDTDEQIYIYFVENGKADEIADILIQLYGGEGKSSGTSKTKESRLSRSRTSSRTRSSRTRSRLGENDRTQRTKTADKTTGRTSGMIEDDIMIVTDEATNSIVVKSVPADYLKIKDTIRRLDRIPRQVLIEVLIAEVTLSGDTEFGIEWALRGSNASIGGYKGGDRAGVDLGLGGIGNIDLTQSLGQGFSYMFDSSRLQAFLIAQASHNKLNILSSPHILAADNQEASIEVGEEVPIVTSEYIPTDYQVNTSTSRSIEYRSTGVILTVTPRVNEKGLVAMEISQEVSEAQPVVAGGIQSPVISNRKAETALVVQHGETIVIGGLIKDRSNNTVTGVPFLSHVPLLSYLFSNTKNSSSKTELVIMITPHVIKTIDEASLATQEFKQKIDVVRKLINKSGDNWIKGYK